jgi:hypothetical protein
MAEATATTAFPALVARGGCDNIGHKDGIDYFPGMSLRDYFAAKVLAMLMHPDAKDYNPEETARRAYLFADAMLKAREAGNV